MYNLIHGDCLEEMKNIPDKSIDLVLTDPPYGTTACKWDIVIPFDLMWAQLHRIIKDNGTIALFGNEPFSSKLRISNIKQYKYDWIWEKENAPTGLHAQKAPMKVHENIVWRDKRFHPTQKPVDLLEYLIKTYTNECETVLDFTMGSGSTGVACVNTNRNFIGIEIDQKYYNIAKSRLEEAEK